MTRVGSRREGCGYNLRILSNSKAGGNIWRGESAIVVKMGCFLNQDGERFESSLKTLPLLTFWSRKHDLRNEDFKKADWDMIRGKAE